MGESRWIFYFYQVNEITKKGQGEKTRYSGDKLIPPLVGILIIGIYIYTPTIGFMTLPYYMKIIGDSGNMPEGLALHCLESMERKLPATLSISKLG